MGHGVAAAINNKTTFVFDVAPQLPPIAQPQHRPFNFAHPPRRMVPRPGHCFQTMQPRPQANFLQRQLHIMQRFLQVPNHESMGWQWGMHVFFREANNTTTKNILNISPILPSVQPHNYIFWSRGWTFVTTLNLCQKECHQEVPTCTYNPCKSKNNNGSLPALRWA